MSRPFTLLTTALLIAAGGPAWADAPAPDPTDAAVVAPPADEPADAPPADAAPAADAAVVAPPADEPAQDAALGLNVDLGFATAYLFRGYNVFQEDSQQDVHMLLAPGVLWTPPDTGFALGYLGSFQVNGDNLSAALDAALGGEQDLYATWTHPLADALSLSVGLTAYLYPFADEQVTGSSCPVYLEPGVKVAYSTLVDLALSVGYFYGLQDEPAIRGISYLYVNPTVAKSFALSDALALGLKLGYGFKLFKAGNDGLSNVHDLAFVASLPITLGDGVYLTPALTVAWTNIEGGVDAAGNDVSSFGDGLAVVGGFNLGVNL